MNYEQGGNAAGGGEGAAPHHNFSKTFLGPKKLILGASEYNNKICCYNKFIINLMLVYKIVIIKAMERALDKHFFGIFSSEIGP